MKNIEVRSEVERITTRELNHVFDAAGLTIERLAKGLKQAVGAKEERAFIHQKTGEIKYAKKMIAHDIRLKAIRLTAELRGDFAPKEINISVAILAGRIQAARRRESERTVQGVRVEPEADNLGGAPQAEEKSKEVQLSE